MTSANVIEYTITHNGEEVGSHSENVMCRSHFEDLLKFVPLEEHFITSWGYDEEEEQWSDEPANLLDFLKGLRSKKIDDLLKEIK